MITALISIQTIAVLTATSYAIKHFRPKFTKMKVYSKSNGYKHYKTF
jgi:hypothetical protein